MAAVGIPGDVSISRAFGARVDLISWHDRVVVWEGVPAVAAVASFFG